VLAALGVSTSPRRVPRVWRRLTGIVLLPSLVALTFAALQGHTRLEQVHHAQQAQVDVDVLVALTQVQWALTDQAADAVGTALIRTTSTQAGHDTALEQPEASSGADSGADLDAALDKLRASPTGSALAERIQQQLTASEKAASPSASASQVISSYSHVHNVVDDLEEQRVEHLFRTASSGEGAPELLLQRLRALSAAQSLLATSQMDVMTVLSRWAAPQQAAPLVSDTDTEVRNLGHTASPQLWQRWVQMRNINDTLVEDLPALDSQEPAAQAVVVQAALKEVSELNAAGSAVRRQAVLDVAQESDRLLTTALRSLLILTAVVAVAAVCVTWGCWRTARSIGVPLRALAARAQAISQGRSVVGDEAGVLETAVVATALNEAVQTLDGISKQLTALGRGDAAAARGLPALQGVVGASLQGAVHRLVELQDQLTEQAFSDPLTGLGNRRAAERWLGTWANSTGAPDLVVAVVGVLGLREHYTAHGYLATDGVLRQWAGYLRAVLPAEARLFRLENDVFALVLDADPAGSMDSAHFGEWLHRIHRLPEASLGAPAPGEPRQRHGSAGYAARVGMVRTSPTTFPSQDTPLDQALYALQRAQLSSATNVVEYDDELHRTRQCDEQMTEDLRRAIHTDELHLLYQPEYDLRTAAVCGVEALVRWSRADGSLVPPDVFVSLAERSDLIQELDRWVLHTAHRQLLAWSRDPATAHLHLAVNVSGRHLRQPGTLTAMVVEVLSTTTTASTQLMLELTETALVGIHGDSSTELEALREMGVQVALDDFGTGYCSIQQLAALPVDYLKIDRDFVSGAQARSNPTLAALMVTAAHSAGIRVIGEGVESVDQLQTLQMYGCDVAQGYLLAEPMTAAAVTSLVKEAGRSSVFPVHR